MPAYTPKARGKARRKPVAKEASAPKPQAVPEGAESWKMTLKTPMGPQEMTMHIVRDGAAFTGRIDSPMGSESVHDGKVEGDALSWSMDVKKPMPLKLSFDAQIAGDTMTGRAKLGAFGTADLSGQRV